MLTKRQDQILRLIATWDRPEILTLKLMAKELGMYDASAVRAHLGPLEEAGYIERPGDKTVRRPFVATSLARRYLGLELPEGARRIKGSARVSMLVHPISCGPMGESVDEGTLIESLSELLPTYVPGDYIEIADGDSMANSHDPYCILNGDRVQCRPDVAPQNGQIVHVEYADEKDRRECCFAVYHCNLHTKTVTLKKLNPDYGDIVRPLKGIIVHGVVVGTSRPFIHHITGGGARK